MNRIMRFIVALALIALGIRPLAAEVGFELSALQVVTETGRHDFTVELAVTDRQLSQGLMNRRSLAADRGMLFDFGADQPVSMWMRNTLISLDMVFIDRRGRVVGIAERTEPMSTRIIASPGPVRAVLELNAGTARRLALKVGDTVVHPMFEQP